MNNTLVVGASLNPERYGNMVIHRLVSHNIPTQAFGVKSGTVATVQIKTKFCELTNIDVVTLYLRPELQKEYYKNIVALQPKRVIFNPGTENREFYELLENHSIKVQIACTLVLLATGQFLETS